jgi:sigma-B regulation protein RsbU (phosphoserine phosphatase)
MFQYRYIVKGLTFKLSLSILTATTLLIFIILSYNYYFSKQLLLESAGETAEQLAGATVSRIDNVFISVQKSPEAITFYLQNPDLKEEVLIELLTVSLQNKPEIFGNSVAFAPYSFYPDREGFAPYCYRTPEGIQFKNLGDDSYKYFNWPWYSLARDKGKPVWTEPYFDEGGGDILMSTFAFPFYKSDSLNRVFQGVVTADLSLSWLEDLMNSIQLFETGYAFLISDVGTIITHPKKELQMMNFNEQLGDNYSHENMEIVERYIKEDKGFLPFVSQINQKPSLMFFYTLPQTGWHMALVITEDELYAGLHRLYINTVFIGILGIILLFAVVILFSSRITKPLRRLTRTADEIGEGNFDVQVKEDRSSREISMLGNALSRMQLELKDYIKNLEITTAVKERFESELNIAHNIQQGMIPKVFPPFPGRTDIDIYALLEPARQVGGDLYDYFLLDENTLCFAIGDVSDKGVPASLMMAMTITLFRAKTNDEHAINEIAGSINHEISRENENMMFVTFFMGMLDLRSGELKFCNAGHNYPILLRSYGHIETLEETHGVPFGIRENMVYQSGKITLKKNDTLILYTDGISEALSVNGDFYGEERLLNLVRHHGKGFSPKQISLAIMEDVADFARTPERSDDITLLVLSYLPHG